MPNGKRWHRRVPVHIIVQVSDIAGFTNHGIMCDLTIEGCGIKMDFPPRDGGDVVLEFNVPGRHISCKAHKRSARGAVHGFQFTKLSEADTLFIKAYLHDRMQAEKFQPPTKPPITTFARTTPLDPKAGTPRVSGSGRERGPIKPLRPARNSFRWYFFSLVVALLIALVARANPDNHTPNGGEGFHYGWGRGVHNPHDPQPFPNPQAGPSVPVYDPRGSAGTLSFTSDYHLGAGPITLNGTKRRGAARGNL